MGAGLLKQIEGISGLMQGLQAIKSTGQSVKPPTTALPGDENIGLST